MKRYNLCTAIIDRVLPAFIALALLTTCRNGGDPSRTEIRSTPESTNGNGRATASGNSSATEEKALLSIYEYNKLDTVFMEDFPAIEEPEEDTVCVVTHRMPSFPGGYDSLTAFIRRNARYPSKAEQENIRGVTWIKCVIDKKGNVVRPEVLVSLSPECDREALRIVRSMPRWEPGMIDRCKPYVNLTEPDTAAKEPAHCYYMIPVYFPPSDN
ncbi:energy transducer TonB [Alistipes ihumii]|jgi:hypothetical protein|nr:energy transducer TonB [Alistipes ihumii]